MQNQFSVDKEFWHSPRLNPLVSFTMPEQCEVAKLKANAKPVLREQEIQAFATSRLSVLRKAERCEVAKLKANAKSILRKQGI